MCEEMIMISGDTYIPMVSTVRNPFIILLYNNKALLYPSTHLILICLEGTICFSDKKHEQKD